MNIAGDREQKLRNSRSDFGTPKGLVGGIGADFKVALRGLKQKI